MAHAMGDVDAVCKALLVPQKEVWDIMGAVTVEFIPGTAAGDDGIMQLQLKTDERIKGLQVKCMKCALLKAQTSLL